MTYQRKLEQKLWRVQNLYKIKNKAKQLTLCKFNRCQWQIVNDIIGQQPIRHFSLKFRQGGVSTFWLLWWLDDCIFESNTTTGILAHKWESLDLLWDIVETAYNNFPEKLPLIKESAKALEFTNGSKIFISLSIRSVGLHNLHISEWCWCKDSEIYATIGAASPATNITGESTGNGVSNDGYNVYQDALKGLTDYKARFTGWFLQDEYRMPLHGMDPDYIMGNLDPDEKKLQKLMAEGYNMVLEPEQVFWRRITKQSLKSMFRQEYPETDEDAFITSGQHFFDLRKAQVLYKEARDWHKKGLFYEVGDGYVCFEAPNNKDVYAMGCDTSEGVTDKNTIKIINVTKRREAFAMCNLSTINKFYKQCDFWGRAYNRALMAVEDNNTGHAVLLGLEEDCRYPNLYKTKKETRLDEKPKVKIGWHTDKFSRAGMLANLKQSIEDDEDITVDDFAPEIVFYDLHLLAELFDFVKIDGKDKYEAPDGKTDDMIFASGIAMEMYYKLKGRLIERKNYGVLFGSERETKL